MYQNKDILLASMHAKEKVIQPVFRRKLACHICVENIDTDKFGTFTGEIPRLLSPYETCLLKAKHAVNKTNYILSMASEGSFGSHPFNPFIPHAHEIMLFFDSERDWVISEQLVTSKTNYNMMPIQKDTALNAFLKAVNFPTHALTLQSGDRKYLIAKGIDHHDKLQASLVAGFKQYDQLFIATDMRAMMNPTRMETLGELAEKLASRIMRCCPGCGIPGFGFKVVCGHLPCGACGDITNLYQYEVWGCINCDYEERRPRQDQLMIADPKHCNYCNP